MSAAAELSSDQHVVLTTAQLELPVDVVALVFDHLEVRSVAGPACVSQMWRSAADATLAARSAEGKARVTQRLALFEHAARHSSVKINPGITRQCGYPEGVVYRRRGFTLTRRRIF